jgi:hypothetical protein
VAVTYALYKDSGNAYYAAVDAAGQVSLNERINGVDSTLASGLDPVWWTPSLRKMGVER